MITPQTHSFSSGESLHADMFNIGIRDVYEFLQEPPQFVMHQTTAQAATTAVWYDVTNWTVDKDNDNFRVAGGAGITINTSGFYQFIFGIGYVPLGTSADITGSRAVGQFMHNTMQGNHYVRPVATVLGMYFADIGAMYGCYMTAGDTVFFRARQNSGVTLNTYASDDAGRARWSGRWISQ